MKNVLFSVSVFLFFSLLTQSVFGVIAYPFPIEIVQPDGTKLTIVIKGDEHVKWAQTVDGYSILRNAIGIYEYASYDTKSGMVPSGILVKNVKDRSVEDNQYLNKLSKGLTYSKSQIGTMKSISRIYKKSGQKTAGVIGTRKLLCILIGFTDKAITKSKTEFQNLFNQVGYSTDGATGSVYDFYKENSYNQLSLVVTVAGPYTAAYNMAYYGGNDASGNDKKPEALVSEAVTKADADVNYADFDNDGDGTVDGVYVIYAGNGEEATDVADQIWAHAYSITPKTLDGKIVSDYSCSAELRNSSTTGITRIGVICHEFGHVMGASDYYDTDYDGKTGVDMIGTGDWDLMASGSWNNNGATPAHHNPYTKIVDYGWATSTTLTSGLNVILNNAEQNSNSFYKVNTATSNEYFLIENRQQQLFDAYLPGHGMIIYHVDGPYISNHINSNDINAFSHLGMYPVCASAVGNPTATYGDINDAGLPFPGSYGKTSFTDATIPNALSWAGANTNKPITNIAESITNKTVSFSFMGGIACSSPTIMATSFTSSDITSNSMTIGWTRGNGDNVLVTVKESSSIDFDPISGNDYTANSLFKSGSLVGNNVYAVYKGTGNSVTVTGLKSGYTYYYSIYEYSNASNCYLTPGLLGSVTISCPKISTFPYSEGFESGVLGSCWLEILEASATHWNFIKGNGSTNPSNAHGGTKNACFQNESTSASVTKLVLPPFDLSALSNPSLQFWHTQQLWESDQDELRIYYKTSASGTWTLLKTFTASITDWTQETVALPTPSADYYIAFEGTAKYGYGVCIDDISISNSTGIDNAIDSKNESLSQNRPNPFNQFTTIDFTIDKPSRVKLSIYNTLGSEVAVIVDEYLQAGTFSKLWTPRGIPAGVYFYQLNINGRVETKKLVKR